MKEHLVRVSELTEKFVRRATNNEDLARVGRIAGLVHDLGKYHPSFQEAIREGRKPPLPHAPFSAIAATYLIGLERDLLKYSLNAFVAVRYHHEPPPDRGRVISAYRSAVRKIRERDHSTVRFIKGIYEAYEEISKIGLGDLEDLLTLRESAVLHLESLLRYMKLSRFNLYFKVETLRSSLIDADRLHAAGIDALGISHKDLKSLGSMELPNPMVLQTRSKADKDVMRTRRDLARAVTLVRPDRRKYIIEAPTGSGKTLSGFKLAVRVARKLDLSRVIYTLPFTSLVDQTYQMLSDLVGSIVKYHHADLTINVEGDDIEGDLEVVDTFDMPVVVTTFNQLFDSFLGKKIRRLHNLAESVVILDEVQTFPVEYWIIVKHFLKRFLEATRSAVVLMSATIPILLDEGDAMRISIPARKSRYYLRYADRVDLDWIVDVAAEGLKLGKKVLVVMNTIRSAREVFFKLKERFPDEVFHLSSYMVPIHRLEVLKALTDRLDRDLPTVLVSTQVVEAGYDLDFDLVLRDVAPLDSVIQTAGRCNRHGLRNSGEVIVFAYENDAKKVYGEEAINLAVNFLEGAENPTKESDFVLSLGSYYAKLLDKIDEYSRAEIRKWLDRLEFEKLRERFNLYPQGGKVPIFVLYNREARSLLNMLTEKKEELSKIRGDRTKFFEVKKQIHSLLIEAGKYTISVWERDAVDIRERLGGIRAVNKDHYDTEVGFLPVSNPHARF